MYTAIAEEIRKDLVSGKYEQTGMLPSEEELTDRFSVSKSTIRKSIAILINKGYIYPVQSQGYYIRESAMKEYISLEHLQGFAKNFPNRKVEGITISLETVQADEELAKKFRLEPGAPLYCLKRLRKVDGKPYVIEYSWYNQNIVPELNEEIAKGSIYRYLSRDLKLPIGYADRLVSADYLDQEQAQLLGLNEKDPALCLENRVFLKNGSVLEVSKMIHHFQQCKMIKLTSWL